MLTSASAQSSPQKPEIKPVFQPDFQGRFWQRLSALAEASQKAAAESKAQMEAAGVEIADETRQSPSVVEPQSLRHEVVVYESDEAADTADGLAQEAIADVPVEVLQPGEPKIEDLGDIPLPTLVLPDADLVAGSPLPVSVRLPLYPRRLAVKVWVTDIQSRTLVDRPRWLMSWTANDDDEQTAFLQLQVPQGSMEVQFEAIAIDLATQRESYKTTVTRSVMPPNFPRTGSGPFGSLT
jgi:hypothetical protein